MLRQRLSQLIGAPNSNRRGSAMIIAIGFSVVIGFAIASTVLYTTHQARVTARRQLVDHSILAAQNAVEAMTSNVVYIINQRPPQLNGSIAAINTFVANVKAPNMPGVLIENSYVTNWPGAPNDFQFRTIDDPGDYWNGYGTTRLDYQVVALAKEDSPTSSLFDFPGTAMRRRVTVDYIPMWAYWALTDSTTGPFELHPGPQMIVRGRVHSNGDMRLSASTELSVYGEVTSVGKFIYGAGESWYTGTLRFATASQLAQERANPGTVATSKLVTSKGQRSANTSYGGFTNQWLDASDPEWVSRASNLWGGTIKDSSFGVNSINPPLPEGSNPLTMIQRVNASDSPEIKAIKFENNADLKIYGNPTLNPNTWYAQDKNGNAIPLTYTSGASTLSVVSKGRYYDRRQEKWVESMDIDMNRLIAWQTQRGFVFDNGILFASTDPAADNSTRFGGVRIINSARVPSAPGNRGLTLASDRPVYTAGAINTTDKKTFLIAADAVTIQSALLNETTNPGNTTTTLPTANNITTNVVLLMGNVPTVPTGNGTTPESWIGTGSQSGGLHNAMRYMENWASRTHTHNGSLLMLFPSQIANKRWRCCGNTGTNGTYSPPNRSYNWDASLITQEPPPGMPTFIFVQKGDWDQLAPDEVATP